MKKTKYHSLDKISQKEFLKLFKGPLKKLLDYARPQGITVEPLGKLVDIVRPDLMFKINFWISKDIPFWMVIHNKYDKRTIYADLRDLESSNQKQKIVTSSTFAHEIAHIQSYDLQIKLENCCFSNYNHVCPFLEYHCWKKALEIIKNLKIPVNSKSFWCPALRFIGAHSKFCPEFAQCVHPYEIFGYKLNTGHKKIIISWRKQAQELGPKEVLKDYSLK